MPLFKLWISIIAEGTINSSYVVCFSHLPLQLSVYQLLKPNYLPVFVFNLPLALGELRCVHLRALGGDICCAGQPQLHPELRWMWQHEFASHTLTLGLTQPYIKPPAAKGHEEPMLSSGPLRFPGKPLTPNLKKKSSL